MSFNSSFLLPDGWRVLTVEQLVNDGVLDKPLDGNHGGIHPKASDYVDNGVPFIMASDLEGGQINLSLCKFISEDQAKGLRKGFSKAGDVLLSHKATIGRTALVQKSEFPFVVLTPQVTYYRVKNAALLDPVYLKTYFDSLTFQTILNQWAGAGSTRAYLGITGQLKLPIIIPPISFQSFLATQANALDKKIQLNQQINQTLEQMAQAIFKNWFVDFEPVKAKIAALEAGGSEDDALLAAMQAISGKDSQQLTQLQTENPENYATLRATAELFPAGMQESELGEIPEGWGTGSFKDLCLTVESGGTPKRNTPEYWGGEIKWLASGEVRDVVVLDTKEKITESGLKNSSAKLWPMYTTVVAMYGATAGQVCLIADQMTSNQACCGLIPKKNYRAFTFFSAKRSIQSLSEKASGSAQQNLNKGLVEGHPAILPSEAILVVYEDIAFPLMLKWIENMRESIMLAELRYTLLPKLLSGELSVSDLQTTNTEAAADV